MSEHTETDPRRGVRRWGLHALASLGIVSLLGLMPTVGRASDPPNGIHNYGTQTGESGMELDGSIDSAGNTCDFGAAPDTNTGKSPVTLTSCTPPADTSPPATSPFDWSTLFDSSGNLNSNINSTTIPGYINSTSPAATSTELFVQGSKDIDDPSAWHCKSQSSPPKDDLSAAYGVVINAPVDQANGIVQKGDVDTYLALERPNTSGSANAGFWFFQQPVHCLGTPGGAAAGFAGTHSNNDLFLVASFASGGTTALLTAFTWNCTPVSSTNPACTPAGSGSLSANPVSVTPTSGLTCPTTSNDALCEVTNQKPATISGSPGFEDWNVTTPWPSITGTAGGCGAGCIPGPGYLEMGIDLSAVFRTLNAPVPCFSNFLTDTRTSGNSTQASTKEFINGSFPTCKPVTVTLKKVDSSGHPLSGAVMGLFTDPGGDEVQVSGICPGTPATTGPACALDASDTPEVPPDNPTAGTRNCTTGADGIGNCTYTFTAPSQNGIYVGTEITPPGGFSAAPNQYVKVSISGASQAITLTFTDTPLPGEIDIVKKDASGNLLSGAVFTIYTDKDSPTDDGASRPDSDDTVDTSLGTNGTCTTDATGACKFTNVPLGTYLVVETTPPAGFQLPTGAPANCSSGAMVTTSVCDVTIGLGSSTSGQTISLTFIDPPLHRLIVLACTEGTSPALESVTVTIDGANPKTSISGPPNGLTNSQLCNLGGAQFNDLTSPSGHTLVTSP